MDIMELGAIGELVGGVAVIATLIYLAIQVRQGNRSTRATARQTLIDTLYGYAFEVGRDEELCRIMGEGSSDWGSITDAEKSRYNLLMLRFAANVQNGLLLKREGMLDQDTLNDVAGQLAAAVRCEGGAAWWRSAPIPPEVRAYIDNHIEQGGDQAPSMRDLAPYWVKRWDREPSESGS